MTRPNILCRNHIHPIRKTRSGWIETHRHTVQFEIHRICVFCGHDTYTRPERVVPAFDFTRGTR